MSWTCILCFLRDDPPPKNTAESGGAAVLGAVRYGTPIDAKLCRIHGALVDQVAQEMRLHKGGNPR